MVEFLGFAILGILIYLLFKSQRADTTPSLPQRDTSIPKEAKRDCLYHNQLAPLFSKYQVPSSDRSPLVTLGVNVAKSSEMKLIASIKAILESGKADSSKSQEIINLSLDSKLERYTLNGNADTNTQEYSYKGLISQIIDFDLEDRAKENFAGIFELVIQKIEARSKERIFSQIKYQLENLTELNSQTGADYSGEFAKIKRNLEI